METIKKNDLKVHYEQNFRAMQGMQTSVLCCVHNMKYTNEFEMYTNLSNKCFSSTKKLRMMIFLLIIKSVLD